MVKNAYDLAVETVTNAEAGEEMQRVLSKREVLVMAKELLKLRDKVLSLLSLQHKPDEG